MKCLGESVIDRPVCHVLGDEIVTLLEDEFLAGFKPLSKATRPMCKVSDVECKVKWTLLIFLEM